ncbi:sigma-70 family RNA polymerase sigma factor [Myxococcus sp. AM010]|uniref:sigma-70 family RNA polymerase sigma factor n=1 Tax=Myxococcus sp. AM010 TaxID=2745138 RepID=UPI0020D1205F|nr:sigma-70 family RNA polymerase sigma factor [Myxococcus sp. AM010]
MRARQSTDAALERRLSAELLASVRPVIRCVVARSLPFAGTLSPEDLAQVATIAVLRTIASYDATRGNQSFGEVAYFRAKAACAQFVRLHASDVHVSDGEHKGRTVRSSTVTRGNTILIHSMDIPSHFSDGYRDDDDVVDELEAALRELSGRDADAESPELALIAAERRALVFEAVRRLAPEQRELVSRVYGLNRPAQSVRSIAEAWKAPKSRIDRMLARVLEELRAMLVPGKL